MGNEDIGRPAPAPEALKELRQVLNGREPTPQLLAESGMSVRWLRAAATLDEGVAACLEEGLRIRCRPSGGRKRGAARATPTPSRGPRTPASGGDHGRAVVQRVDDDHVLVVGETTRAAWLGTPVAALEPGAVARYLTMWRDEAGVGRHRELGSVSGNGLLQTASLLQGIEQAGTIYRVAEVSRPLLSTLQPATSGKHVLGILRDSGEFAHIIRWDSVGTGLRSFASLSGLMFAVAVVAGQSRMFKTQQVMMHALGDLVDAHREDQFAELRAKSQSLEKFLALAQLGFATPSVVQLLPNQEELQILVNRADAEVERRIEQLRHLPSPARELLPQLKRMVPDILAASTLYVGAEQLLSATEQLNGMILLGEGDASAEARMRYEAGDRDRRLRRQEELSDALRAALANVADKGGSGWFTGDQNREIREVADRTRADIAALRSSGLTTLAVNSGS